MMLATSIDKTARDAEQMQLARCIISAIAGIVIAAILNQTIGLAWLFCAVAIESWCAVIRSRLARDASQLWRLQYVVMASCLTALWTTVPVLLWFTHQTALQMTAIMMLFSQLLSAQALAFRSVVLLAVGGGFPAAALVLLPLYYGSFKGLELVVLAAGTLLSLGYFAAAVVSNAVHTARLDQVQAELEQIAYFDVLTSLANRRLFFDHLRRLIANSGRRQSPFALLLLDLDDFKHINDDFGHAAGDICLNEIGARLSRAVREGDYVARIGGDEFAILLPDTSETAAIERICERIRDGLANTIQLNNIKVIPSCSIGIARYPANSDEEIGLLRAADLAMYQAKRRRRTASDEAAPSALSTYCYA